MKPVRLILLPASAEAPAPWLIVGADGRIVDRGELSLDRPDAGAGLRTVAVAPGVDVLVRWVEAPPGSPAQQQTAALWALRDDLAAPPERLTVALGPRGAPGEARLAAVVSTALVEAWRAHLAALGVTADALIPDMLTVPEPVEPGVVCAVRFGDALALRGARLAATVDPELAALVAGEAEVRPLEAMEDVERALAAAAQAPVVNLLQTAPVASASADWRRAAVLAALLLISPLVLTAGAAGREEISAKALNRAADQAAVEARSDLADEADPAAALHARAQRLPPPGGSLGVLAGLAEAVENVDGAELDAFVADGASGVKATVNHAARDDLRRITARLAEGGLKATQTSSLDEGGRMVSDLDIGSAR